MTHVADSFAHSLLRLSREPLAPNVAREAKRSLINVLGTSIGAAAHPGVDAMLALALESDAEPIAPVPGRAERTDAHFSALATGFAAHVDDFDDTHLATVIHPAASTLAVLSALGAETSPSGSEALVAFALGCEAQLRLGVAISPEHYDRGWHITGTCGVVGAAVTAALLLKLDEAGVARALRVSASMFVGQREAFGTMAKPFHPGKAAANGIDAARLAAAGIDAAPDIFEAEGGFCRSLSIRVDFGQMLDDMGQRWELLSNTYKPYPCGIVAHPAIDAGLAVAPRIADVEKIASITLRCHPLVPELMGNPQPIDGLQARFSAIHGVAAALCDKQVGLAQYETARVNQDDVRALRALTRLVPDPGIRRDEVEIDIQLQDGTSVSAHVEHARGSLARPLTEAELMDKVRLLIDPRLGTGRAAQLAGAVFALDTAPSVDALFQLTQLEPETNHHG